LELSIQGSGFDDDYWEDYRDAYRDGHYHSDSRSDAYEPSDMYMDMGFGEELYDVDNDGDFWS
jgi:hypothetical protein